jgi:hypothetical protein
MHDNEKNNDAENREGCKFTITSMNKRLDGRFSILEGL